MENKITPERLREKLSYDPNTGLIFRRLSDGTLKGPIKPGKTSKHPYIEVAVDYQQLRGARVAWAYHYGEWPNGIVDHKNGDKSDNRIDNLRIASFQVNAQNRVGSNRLRVIDLPLGVYPRGQRFESRICIAGVKTFFGPFDTAQEASDAYMEFRRKNCPGNTI